jgi:DNA-binding transcriptional ArsR family regulator
MVTNVADPFRGMADPTRRALLAHLTDRPHGATELADHFDVSRPAISKHLRVLREARLVRERREGRNRIYELDSTGIETLRLYFERFWSDALAAFKRGAEQAGAETTTKTKKKED